MVSLAHVNIRTSRLEESVSFYRDALGLVAGPAATRPDSPNHVWMSDAYGSPCVHLQRTDSQIAINDAEQCGVHHVALACSSPDLWRDKLRARNIDFSEKKFEAADLLQFNLRDPNGVRLELLFEIR
jgi:catechol-2,3-dioxygenase